jgi:hypothetical protein
MVFRAISKILDKDFNYLCTYDLYRPVRNAFDAGSILYKGKWEGGWALEIESFLSPVKWNRADRRVPLENQTPPPPPSIHTGLWTDGTIKKSTAPYTVKCIICASGT